MDKGLFFLIIALAMFWLVLDDFFGKKYVSNLANNIAPKWATNPKEAWNDYKQNVREQGENMTEQEAIDSMRKGMSW